jgi:hypothetical protein
VSTVGRIYERGGGESGRTNQLRGWNEAGKDTCDEEHAADSAVLSGTTAIGPSSELNTALVGSVVLRHAQSDFDLRFVGVR